MTREEAKELFKKASDIACNYLEHVEIVSMHNIDIVLSEIYNDHEEQLKAKNERIRELEEAMKPKTCEGCKHRSHLDESLTNKTTNGFCVENGFFTRHGFCCNKHEPKDNA